MQFSIYTEIQRHGDKPFAQLYDEVIDQIVHADRVGFDTYAIIEHFFFEGFSASANPWALLAKASERAPRIKFRTMGHPLPYYNPTVLASQIAQFDLLVGQRYEFGVLRGHGWIPKKAGIRMEDTVGLYEESLEIVFLALENETFSYDGKFYTIENGHIVPRPLEDRRFRVFLGGTSDRTYELAGERGWAVAVPPLLPYEALADQLDLYRKVCETNGHDPDIVWIHACYIDEDRDTAIREAETMMRGFLEGNASPLVAEGPPGTPEELEAGRYQFYGAGILEDLAKMPYEKMIEDDVVWVGTPADVIERIETVQGKCVGLTEVAITVNPGGVDHWKSIKAQELFAREVIPHFRRDT
ncbi:MAG TPA: LLM class flavin-dependent oxidoreductase [Acidimicrobiia bacterium]